MASSHLPNHLLAHRKRSALSQAEVAFLLGVQSGVQVCRYEGCDQEPRLQTALAYEAVYRRPVSELFPDLFEKIQREVRARAEELGQTELHSNSSGLTARKRQFLAAIAAPEIVSQ